MRFWTHDRFGFPLPEGHRFPLPKYRLLREAVERERLGPVLEAAPIPWEDLALAHAPAMLHRIRTGALGRREERVLGLPWSPQLVHRARRATQGTVEAAHDALATGLGMNLGGGTHHAGPDAARGYCLVNDVVVAVRVLRRDAGLGRVLVVDLDVHQGDGTAELCAEDPATFTVSLHGARNLRFARATSDLDVDLATGTGDDAYLDALGGALDRALAAGRPELLVLLAGADAWEGDALGRLALTRDGLRRRDALVLDRAAALGVPVCVTLAGGYAPDVRDTVAINLATARQVAARAATAPTG